MRRARSLGVSEAERGERTPGRFRRVGFVPVVFGGVLLIAAVCVVFGEWIAPRSPLQQDLSLGVTGPGRGHPLGTDDLGRDAFSQLIVGARSALLGPAAVALGCILLGGSLGVMAAYFGGFFDAVVNRMTDLIFALPGLLVALVVIGVTGGSYWLTVLLFIFLMLPTSTRLCRSAALGQVRLPYVDAAKTLGLGSPQILFSHVLPNIMPTVVATVLLDFVAALVAFTSLSYLGLGVSSGSPDWGEMMSAGQSLLPLNPWLTIGPALALVAVAASATMLGDRLFDLYRREGESR